MAKSFVRTSLATKLRLVFGAAALAIIAAALVVPWYFLELLAERGVERSASELTQLRLAEWSAVHPENLVAARDSSVARFYTRNGEVAGKKGPVFIVFLPDVTAPSLDPIAADVVDIFRNTPGQELAVIESADEQGQMVYRCFRAVRARQTCMSTACHSQGGEPRVQFQADQLVALIDMTMPSSAAGSLVWWARGAFVVAGALAALLAFIVFAILTQRLILRPVSHLRDVADKVTDGDLNVRSTVRTGDELQRLGESFNEMLAAITRQHGQLRSANRALDLKMHELEEVNVTLFHANKVKSDFLANVSHELRTPLNSIIGFADLLSEAGDDNRIHHYGNNISVAAKNLLRIINDLLEVAKIEAGKAVVRVDKVSVTDTCQMLLALMKPLADRNHLILAGDLSDELPIVITDGGKLQQILFNLLSNAIKFTPAGGEVTLSTCLGERNNGDGCDQVLISVADTGPGIAEVEQQHVFEKFYQIDHTLIKGASGTGLGLAIARDLTGLLGGRLALKSSPGQGAVFTVILPVEARPQNDDPRDSNA